MARSFLFSVALLVAIAAGACSSSTAQQQKPLPEATVRTATMDITPGITVLARIRMPDGFVPIPDRPPMWLEDGKEIAVAGIQNDHTVILGFSGPGWETARVIAEDGGVSGKDARIVDAAATADGMQLALATFDPAARQAAVVVRDLISGGEGHPIATFDGDFDAISIAWVSRFTIALALRARKPDPAAQPPNSRAGEETPPQSAAPSEPGPAEASAPEKAPKPPPAAEGLYLIGTSGTVLAELVKLDCKLSALAWDPKGTFAVGLGDSIAPSIVIDRERAKCQQLVTRAPIRVLGWARDGTSFLYSEIEQNGQPATFTYDMAQHSSRLVAVSSGAAAFVDHKVLALGNAKLSFARVEQFPQNPVHAELALVDPLGAQIDVQALGFNSTPAMFAQSTMTFARRTSAAAIVAFSPAAGGAMRKIVTYSVPNKSAFMVAFGPAVGALSISWSPRGSYLAIADGAGAESALTVIKPIP